MSLFISAHDKREKVDLELSSRPSSSLSANNLSINQFPNKETRHEELGNQVSKNIFVDGVENMEITLALHRIKAERI